MCRHFAGNATLLTLSRRNVTIIYPIFGPRHRWLDVVFGPKAEGCLMIHSLKIDLHRKHPTTV